MDEDKFQPSRRDFAEFNTDRRIRLRAMNGMRFAPPSLSDLDRQSGRKLEHGSSGATFGGSVATVVSAGARCSPREVVVDHLAGSDGTDGTVDRR